MTSAAKLHDHDAPSAAAHALGVTGAELAAESGRLALERTWAGLEAAARAVLSALVALGGEGLPAWLLFEAEEELTANGAPAGSARGALDDLWERGLVARDRTHGTYFVTPALLSHLMPLALRHEFEALPACAPPTPEIDEHGLACALALARGLPLKLTRDNRLHARSVQGLAERMAPLLGPAPIARAEDLVAALRRAGLLAEAGGSLRVQPAAAERWAHLPAVTRAEEALAAGSDDAGALLRCLRLLRPDGAWPTVVLARTLRRAVLCQRAAPPEPSEPAAFAASMAARAAAAVTALRHAGLAALTPRADVALTAGGRSHPRVDPIEQPTRFHVGEDLSILAPRGLPLALHVQIGCLARLESGDVVARYRLDEARILDALESGASALQLLTFLDTHATPALPRSVREDVTRWCSRFGEVSSHEGVTVTCAVAARHEEFAAVVERSALLVELLAPGVAVVDPRDHAAFLDDLRGLGFAARLRAQRPRAAAAAAATAHGPVRPPALLPADLDGTACWGVPVADLATRRATPPPRPFRARLKQKYCRDFGSAQLALLDVLDLDALLEMEEKGRVRSYLSGIAAAQPAHAAGPELSDLLGPDLVPLSASKARALLAQAAAAGLTCQVGYVVRPGQRTRLTVLPLAVTDESSGAYLRARAVSSGDERLIAVERIHGIRVVPASETDGRRPRLTR